MLLVLHGLGSGTWEGKESRTQLRDGDSAETAASRVGGGGPGPRPRLAEKLRDLGIAAHLGDPQGGHAVAALDTNVSAGREEELRARPLVVLRAQVERRPAAVARRVFVDARRKQHFDDLCLVREVVVEDGL